MIITAVACNNMIYISTIVNLFNNDLSERIRTSRNTVKGVYFKVVCNK